MAGFISNLNSFKFDSAFTINFSVTVVFFRSDIITTQSPKPLQGYYEYVKEM